MRSKCYCLLGGFLLLVAAVLGFNPHTREDVTKVVLDWLLDDNSSKNRHYTSSQSERNQIEKSFRQNTVVGESWQNLLEEIPLQPNIAQMSVPRGEAPIVFEKECKFLAKIWAKRLHLEQQVERRLVQELLLWREQRWKEMMADASHVSAEGKTYVIASADKFEKELWAQNWVEEAWPILLDFQQGAFIAQEQQDLRIFKSLAKQEGWSEEMLVGYFGEGESRNELVVDELEALGELISKRFREDEVLFLFWLLPELQELQKRSVDLKVD